ncbi:hypothetical protein CHS0354_040101 [Potamilus streckersoni]|uniref:Uncharacterized protein n=1 Tax=Potamilus streckersoni TaxID=2493646 RepID=A0AAE0SAP8_9BIVA|nr:hypothetical protein CHS0354_040101 [Potamilus streckersoni]
MTSSLIIKQYSGDSESGVFLLDKKNKLTCIGLAIGYVHDWLDTYTVVTPITYVLKALGLPLESKHFEKGTAVQDMTTSRTSFDPANSPSPGIETRGQRKRKANQTISCQGYCLSLSSPSPPEKKRKN